MKSVMQHKFSQIPRVEIPRSVFDRSHGYKTTFNAGDLVPIFIDEALPGDTFRLQTNIFARLTTPKVPFMDNLFLETFYFAIPYRLLWDNFQRFMGEQDNPDDSTDFEIPQIVSLNPTGFESGSLADYFGMELDIPNLSVSALFHRAYNLCWKEWFRDENLQDSPVINKGDGPDTPTDYPLLKRGKRHDYFTSCLPWPQKGPGVELPIGATATVYGDGKSMLMTDGYDTFELAFNQGASISDSAVFLDANNTNETLPNSIGAWTYPDGDRAIGLATKTDVGAGSTGLYADFSTGAITTINEIREAFQMQKMLERDARGGTRYTELVRSHFGTISPDARLQRPEFLGGSSQRININPVQQTSATLEATTPQGNLAAYGLVTDTRGGFTKSFTEHTIIIGLVNVRADITYQRGLNRMFSRITRYDHYWPSLAHLGEQEVLNKEIFCDGTAADNEVFGYQERFAEYRYKPSMITGKFRSTDPQSLDVWHLAEDFESRPSLSSEFITDQTATSLARVLAVQDEPQFIMDCYMNYRCARPMPVYSVPGLVDHF